MPHVLCFNHLTPPKLVMVIFLNIDSDCGTGTLSFPSPYHFYGHISINNKTGKMRINGTSLLDVMGLYPFHQLALSDCI